MKTVFKAIPLVLLMAILVACSSGGEGAVLGGGSEGSGSSGGAALGGGGVGALPNNPANKIATSWGHLYDIINNPFHPDYLGSPGVYTIIISVPLEANCIIFIPSGYIITLLTPQSGITISRGEDLYIAPAPFEWEMFSVMGTLKLGDPAYPQYSKLTFDGGAPSISANSSLIEINSGTLEMYNNVVLENNVISPSTISNAGGAVNIAGGIFNMFGGIIRNNRTLAGGGVCCVGDLNMSGSAAITSNIATNAGLMGYGGFGGGVCIFSGSLTMKDTSSITGNIAESDSGTSAGGGGVSFGSSSGDIQMGGWSTISDNIVIAPGSGTTAWGGGVYFMGIGRDLIMMGNSKINGNKIMEDALSIYPDDVCGGGIFFASAGGTLKMSENSEIGGNEIYGTSSAVGGGVSLWEGTFDMIGGTIHGNIAQSTVSEGGGVWLGLIGGGTGTTFIMRGTAKVGGNNAASNGGGVFVGSIGTLHMLDSTTEISGNIASNNGGGIYLEFGGSIFHLQGGTVSGTPDAAANTASGYGSSLYAGSGALPDYGSYIPSYPGTWSPYATGFGPGAPFPFQTTADGFFGDYINNTFSWP